MKRIVAALALLLPVETQAGHHELPECRAAVEIYSGTTLARLADNYFGDTDYRFAILLATNARAGKGFDFIGTPEQLPVGKSLCIPTFAEAEVEKNRFLTYEHAVRDMALPHPSETTAKLDPIDPSQPAKVVSWVRADQARSWQSKIGPNVTTTGDMWVTEVPHLQNFCATYVNDRGPDPVSLTLRLEQRLGLAPQSAKTHFVEFEIASPGTYSQIFRPCVDPDVTTSTCAFGAFKKCKPPQDETDTAKAAYAQCQAHYSFFTSQYYNSYGTSLPTEFPWTSLGYTFDWAHEPIGLADRPRFIQFGESEYVVPSGAKISVLSVTPTVEYCTPK